VTELVAARMAKSGGRISAKRLLLIARAAGYEGSARNLRRLVAAQKVLWRKDYVRFATRYGFSANFCHAGDPQSKGIVENLCGYAQSDLAVPLLTEAAMTGQTGSVKRRTEDRLPASRKGTGNG
jgi:transposase